MSKPFYPPASPSRLTCYAGHTSRSGGPESPGRAHMTCTAHSFPRALASPGRKGTRPQDLTRHIPGTPSSLTSSHYCVHPDRRNTRDTPLLGLPPVWFFQKPVLVTLPQPSQASPWEPRAAMATEPESLCTRATQRRTDHSGQSYSPVCLDSKLPGKAMAHRPQS